MIHLVIPGDPQPQLRGRTPRFGSRPYPEPKSQTYKAVVVAIDNWTKIVADALNMVAYWDDKQIVTEHTEKWYSDRPRLEIDIKRWMPSVKGEDNGSTR